mgnify:CR=1 FL=1
MSGTKLRDGMVILALILASGCWRAPLSLSSDASAMVETRFLLPVASNTGIPFEESRFEWLEEQLTRRFGGFTYEGEFRGGYYHKGKILRETSRRYVVAVRRAQLPELMRFLHEVKRDFKQEALYVVVSTAEVQML